MTDDLAEAKRHILTQNEIERLRAKTVLAETGCWNWIGSISSSGYGQIAIKRNGVWLTKRVHRVAYEALVGLIPDGLQLDHLCRNRKCCNPKHLEPVTNAENVRRGESGVLRKEKNICQKGHPLTPDNTREWGPSRHCRICERERQREVYRQKYANDASFRALESSRRQAYRDRRAALKNQGNGTS